MEAAANTVAGIVMGWGIMWAFGIPASTTLSLTFAFVVASNLRAYALRRLFDRLWQYRDRGDS
jgi:phosphate/sulfate permease